jgi:hypothetical protein
VVKRLHASLSPFARAFVASMYRFVVLLIPHSTMAAVPLTLTIFGVVVISMDDPRRHVLEKRERFFLYLL